MADREDVSNIIAMCGGKPVPAYVLLNCKKDVDGTVTSFCIMVSDEIGVKTVYYWDKDGTMPDTRVFGKLYSGMCQYMKEPTAQKAIKTLHDFFRDRRVICYGAEDTFYPLRYHFECCGNEPRADVLDLKEKVQTIFRKKKDFSLSSAMDYMNIEYSTDDNVISELRGTYEVFLKLSKLGMLEV